MTNTLWVPILLAAVGAATSLLIAYQHRKQVRQIELYRADPTVGLKPPPNLLTRFLMRSWAYLLQFGSGSYLLVKGFMGSVRREAADPTLDISLGIVFLTWAIFFLFLEKLLDRSFRLADRVIAVQERLVERAEAQHEVLTQIIEALGKAGELPQDVKDRLETLLAGPASRKSQIE